MQSNAFMTYFPNLRWFDVDVDPEDIDIVELYEDKTCLRIITRSLRETD